MLPRLMVVTRAIVGAAGRPLLISPAEKEAAGAVGFLACARAGYITGSPRKMNGGIF
jgi:hypothetical protein